MQPLNSPVEVGLRSIVILSSMYPSTADINRLVLMDHCLLHSADLGGPVSVLPAIPARGGELGLKRTLVEHGIRVMMRAGMIEALSSGGGIEYSASEQAGPFLRLLESKHLQDLTTTANWVVGEFGSLSETSIRERVASVWNHWSEELGPEVPINEILMAAEDDE